MATLGGSPPFDRGQTFFNGGTVDANAGVEYEGQEYWFPDKNYASSDPIKPLRSHAMVKCRIVRNGGDVTLRPKRLCAFNTSTAAKYVGQALGYSAVSAQHAYPVDEFLPAAGVAQNDLFYVVVEGPATCLMPLSSLASDVSVGDALWAITAVTTGATTAGRVSNIVTAATSGVTLGRDVVNMVGRALTARTTGETDANILVNVGKW